MQKTGSRDRVHFESLFVGRRAFLFRAYQNMAVGAACRGIGGSTEINAIRPAGGSTSPCSDLDLGGFTNTGLCAEQLLRTSE